MKKVLIIGSKGMAGHLIYYYFKENTRFEIIDVARSTEFHTPTYQQDVTDFAALKKLLKDERPDYIINCIGVLNKDAEDHPDKAILLNSYLPHFLARLGAEFAFKVIHISTDCVFNGKTGGYIEESKKDGDGFYAQSKALGELEYGNNLTIRTSIIGPELKQNGIGLFHWFMKQKGSIKGYREAYWSGVTTLELAKALISAIEQNVCGLQHLGNNKKINKYELLLIFKEIFKRETINIHPDNTYAVDKSLVKTKEEYRYLAPSYEIMIDEMKAWMIKHEKLYGHYGPIL